MKGVTIQTDSEFFGTERNFFVKKCKVRKIPRDLKESFVTFSLSSRLGKCSTESIGMQPVH